MASYMLIKYEGEYQERFLNTYTQNILLCSTNYVAKKLYLATMLILVQYRFHNHWWSDGKHNAKVGTVN